MVFMIGSMFILQACTSITSLCQACSTICLAFKVAWAMRLTAHIQCTYLALIATTLALTRRSKKKVAQAFSGDSPSWTWLGFYQMPRFDYDFEDLRVAILLTQTF